MKTIAVLLTCYNRRAKTLASLRALFCNTLPDGFQLKVVLVDDGSTDGTSDAVLEEFPLVDIHRGDGSLFWNRGMHMAHQIAIVSNPEFVLWLNDDTELEPNALINLLATYTQATISSGKIFIVVGATLDPRSNTLTYGGLRSRSRLRRFNYVRLPLSTSTQECDAMNGNIVLIPRIVYQTMGAVDPAFEHAMGDIDYALRAREADFYILVAPGFQGRCAANSPKATFQDSTLPPRIRWKKFVDRKCLPPSSWLHFVKRHARASWPLYFFYPYISFAARIIRDDLSQVLNRLSNNDNI